MTRSRRLGFAQTSTSGRHVFYTCPSDKFALVKFIALEELSGVASNVYLSVQPFGSTPVYDLASYLPLGAGAVTAWTGFVVMQPGDKLSFYTTGAGAGAIAFGAELPAA
jgi:hypothetical protein